MCACSAYFALGVQYHCLRTWNPQDLVLAAVQWDAYSGRQVEVDLRELRIELGSWRGGQGIVRRMSAKREGEMMWLKYMYMCMYRGCHQ